MTLLFNSILIGYKPLKSVRLLEGIKVQRYFENGNINHLEVKNILYPVTEPFRYMF